MKKYIRNIVLTLFILIIVLPNKKVYAINNNINFQNITVDDGLAQSLVEAIYQDSKGYIWLATGDGLNRYNGSEFKVYKNNRNDENSISNNSISCIIEDKEENLWVGTYNGLNKINLNTGKITRYFYSNEGKSISDNSIQRLMIDSKDRLWICTDKGLDIYDYNKDEFIKILDGRLTTEKVRDIDEDYKGRIWIATSDGLNMYDENTDEVTKFYSNEDVNSISDNYIYNIYCSGDELWIGTKSGGLNKLDINNYNVKRYVHDDNNKNTLPSNYVMYMTKDKNGVLWVGTNNGLAAMNDDESFTTYKKNSSKYSICDNNIIYLYEDNLGTMWTATYNGVSIFRQDKNFKTYKHDLLNDNSLSADSVCGIYEDDDGEIWVGTFGAGLNKINPITDKVTRYSYNIEFNNSISNDTIRDITGIGNEIWIATDDGLNMYDKNTGKFTIYKSSNDENSLIGNGVRKLYIDKNGLLWIGTKNGLCTFDRKGKFTSYNWLLEENDIDETIVSEIFEDSNGIIWLGIGNNIGLVKYDRNNNSVKVFKSEFDNNNSLSSNIVRSVAEDKKGNIWIGTRVGLNKFDVEKEEFTVYTSSEGLSNDFIYGILVDDNNNIWASTNYGMSMYDSDNNKFIRYYVTDGFANNEFNGFSYYKNKYGEMYFGGVNGVTKFNPIKIKKNDSIPNIVIDSIKTSGGIELGIDSDITLEYNSRELFVKFFIPDYKSINEIQYAYKIEGIESKWVFLENDNYIRYASLEPGRYKVSIKGRNNNGIWSEISTINVTVKNSPWKTPWAYCIYLAIIVTIICIIWNEVKILDALVIQRTQQLNDKLEENKELYNRIIEGEKYKNNYFVNLSHELRTPLNVILSVEQLISSLRESGIDISNEKMCTYMNTLKRNSNRLLNLINNIIDTSKIESGTYKINKERIDIVSLVEDTALSMVELAQVKGLELIIDPEVEEKFIRCDKLDIERCIINLIGNAIKFTEKGGSIHITLKDLGDNIKISVKDTGVGIDSKYFNSIFDRFGQIYNQASEEFGGSGLGLTLTKSLINLHNGYISVVSEKGVGSEFIIILPVD